MQSVDAHCHLWELSRGDYDWLDVSDPAYSLIARDFSASNLADARQSTGIQQVVVVQAAKTQAETEYLLSLADKHPEIAGVVGWVDLANDDAITQIEALSSHPKFKGIRPMLQDIENTNWLLDVPKPEVWQYMANKGLRFDALVKPRHLTMLHQFCLDNPNLPIVIDHAAKPELAAGDQSPIDTWMSDMAVIAKETNAFCKLSGLLTEMNTSQLADAERTLTPVVAHLIACFGPSRLMWGSDWPVVRLAGDYSIWHDLTVRLFKNLDAQSITAILGGTATDFYGLQGHSS